LLPQNKLAGFDERMSQFRQELLEAARELSGQYEQIKSEARRRLGSLFNPADYPTTFDGMFDLEVSYPPIEPPHYLIALNPGVFEAEQARVRERFESAVELAEQAYAGELQKLVTHLAERLTGLQDGQPKVFRDTAITNFTEFFDRFRRLNVRSNPELDALVDQAREVITIRGRGRSFGRRVPGVGRRASSTNSTGGLSCHPLVPERGEGRTA